MAGNQLPELAANAVLVKLAAVPEGAVEVTGIDYSKQEAFNPSAALLVLAMKTMGFQALLVGQACDIIDEMRAWRGQTRAELEAADEPQSGHFTGEGPEDRQRATVFLGYTSNLILSGLRETIRFLVEHKMVDAIVASAGGVEEDLIKCLLPTYMGEFALKGAGLREQGMNRIGNLLVPNDNYCRFEEWIVPVLDKMLEEQTAQAQSSEAGVLPCWTPSTFIHRLGKEINDPSLVLYWCYKNDIPVFCPALTDGLIGDMLFFHTFKAQPDLLKVDIVGDIRRINLLAMAALHSGMVILGGGVVKHHICNANLMRNGADWAVYINTGQEFDGSDAGARPDEAVLWGKIKAEARMVKVYADATVVFPLIVGATFAREAVAPAAV